MSASHFDRDSFLRRRSADCIKTIGLNIGAHKEAIEHFLSALALQESSGGEKSEQLWTTLRRAFQTMVSALPLVRSFAVVQSWAHSSVPQDRQDLADLARPGTKLEAFREVGFDF